MQRYVMNPKPEKSVRVFGRGLRVSEKDGAVVCKAITGKNLEKAQTLLDRIVAGKESFRGKHHTSTVQTIQGLLKTAEAATESKGLAPGRMFISASAHQGFEFATPRRFKHRGKRRKVTHIQLILQQR